jgi:hypothetical protein
MPCKIPCRRATQTIYHASVKIMYMVIDTNKELDRGWLEF